jgi:hypothetical protein
LLSFTLPRPRPQGQGSNSGNSSNIGWIYLLSSNPKVSFKTLKGMNVTWNPYIMVSTKQKLPIYTYIFIRTNRGRNNPFYHSSFFTTKTIIKSTLISIVLYSRKAQGSWLSFILDPHEKVVGKGGIDSDSP